MGNSDTKTEYLFDSNELTEWMIKSEEIKKINRKRFILKNWQCPGDILMLTACVRDIKKWYPDVELGVDTSIDEIWYNNPHISDLDKDDQSVFELDMKYDCIHQSNQDLYVHFIHGFIEDFNKKTGLVVKLTDFKADIHLTDEEKENPVFEDQEDKFVLMNAGGKTDYESKLWWNEAWTEVVQKCEDIQFIQVGKTDDDEHLHEEVKADNCLNKLGKTSIRDVIRLVYQSVGTLSVVTSIMHMAAAFDRHAAVVAGGHEPWWWEKYPGHDYFHTIGALSCCKFGGCWEGKCKNKNNNNRQRCLEMIDPNNIANAIKTWF